MRVKNNIEFRKNQQGTVKKLEPENGEIDDPVKINKELNSFFETFFKVSMKKHHLTLMKCSNKLSIPFLNCQEKQDCDNDITGQKITYAIRNISSNKTL